MQNAPNIPFNGIDRFYHEHTANILRITEEAYQSGQVLMGPEVLAFEQAIASSCNRKYAITVGSCTDALTFALRTANIGQDDQVLITGFSYLASATPILHVGAEPVFVDIDPSTYMMNLDELESKITDRTKAIIAVHLFGQVLDIERLEFIATKNNITLIEDAAQALGGTDGLRKAGSMGAMSCISFDPTKVIGAFGNGGVLLTDDSGINARIQALRSHGKNQESGEFECLGYNSKISSAQAGLLNYQLEMLSNLTERRGNIANLYQENLSGIQEITLPAPIADQASNFHKYAIRLDQRNDLQNHLQGRGIQTKVHYPYTIPELHMFNQAEEAKSLTEAQKARSRLLSLPIYPELTEEEAVEICGAIKGFFES